MKARAIIATIIGSGLIGILSASSVQACQLGNPLAMSRPSSAQTERACPPRPDMHVSQERREFGKEELIQAMSAMAAGGVEMAARVLRAVAEEVDRQTRTPDDI